MNQYVARLWASFLVLSLLLLTTACGGNDTTATTMHLVRAEGTVAVSDDNEKDIPLMENLGLYNGYGVGTDSESYAWINLDDVKLTKMDQESDIAIQKEGKVLEIEIKSGSLFFNVTQPLEDDETMNISTSTMLVGIRGTCGWVEDRDGLSRVYLLEGRVECSAGGRTVQVSAGEMAELTADGEIIVTAFTKQDIPVYVRDEVEPDLIDGLDEVPRQDDSEPSESPSTPDTIGVEGEAYYEPGNGDDLLDALRSAMDGTVITLTKDIEAEATEYVDIRGGSEDTPVVLDLNGYTLTMAERYIIRVYGALCIRDSSGTDSGTLDLPRPDYRNKIEVNESGRLLLESGTINGLVVFGDDSIFTMMGGTFNYLVSLSNNATFTMNDGTINSGDETAVAVVMDSTFIMNGGEIISSGYNETIDIVGNGRVELNGGRITKNGNYVFSTPSSDETFITIRDTVVRSTENSFFSSGSRNWYPDGYASTPERDGEGYYYLVKQ